jgi:hypothetical protein
MLKDSENASIWNFLALYRRTFLEISFLQSMAQGGGLKERECFTSSARNNSQANASSRVAIFSVGSSGVVLGS